MKIFRNFFKFRESGLLIINIVLILVMSLIFPAFASRPNIYGILYYISVNAIIIGSMTVLFTSGGFDLSVGATLGFSSMLLGYLIVRQGLPIVLAIVIVILVGAVFGTSMGYIISYWSINHFIVTLAGWFIIEAFKFILSSGNILGFPSWFDSIALYQVFGKVPTIIIFALLNLIIFDILLRKNVYFRNNYAVGGNEPAAILVGINVKRFKMLNYTLTGIMAAIAGIFLTSRFNQSYIEAGSENAFQIITAVIIGGASLRGGRGTVLGSFLGLIFMALVNSALIMLKVNVYWNKVALGFILIVAVLIDSLLNRENRTELGK